MIKHSNNLKKGEREWIDEALKQEQNKAFREGKITNKFDDACLRQDAWRQGSESPHARPSPNEKALIWAHGPKPFAIRLTEKI